MVVVLVVMGSMVKEFGMNRMDGMDIHYEVDGIGI